MTKIRVGGHAKQSVPLKHSDRRVPLKLLAGHVEGIEKWPLSQQNVFHANGKPHFV